MPDDEDGRPWWRHSAVIAAVIGGVFTIVGVFVASAINGDDGDDGDDGGGSVHGVEATLDSEVGHFNVRCPTTIVFEGVISVSGGRGEVAYRFVHVDVFGGTEQREATQSVSFDGAGSAAVRHEWTPTIPEGEVFRTAAIEVLSPVSIRSDEVTVTGVCDANLPEGPPTPPPDVEPPSG